MKKSSLIRALAECENCESSKAVILTAGIKQGERIAPKVFVYEGIEKGTPKLRAFNTGTYFDFHRKGAYKDVTFIYQL